MSYGPNQMYPGATELDPNYPRDKFKDNNPSTTNNGTPLKAIKENQDLTLETAVMNDAGFEYNGLPDTPQDSQLFKAYKASLGNGANLLSNHNFLIQTSDDSQPLPSATPTSYPPGHQIFSGVFANETTGITNLTYIDGRVSFSGGDLYFAVPNAGAIERLTDFAASVADFDGKPRTRGVSFSLVGDEYRVTVGVDALEDAGAVLTPLGSVKFEQGSVATGHGVGALSTGNLSDYTDIVYNASSGKSAVENMIAGVPTSTNVGETCRSGWSRWERVSTSSGDISDFKPISGVSPTEFGAVGGKVGNDVQAIIDAASVCKDFGVPLYFHQDEYLVSGNIETTLADYDLLVFGNGAEIFVSTPFNGVPAVGFLVDGGVNEKSCYITNLKVDLSIRGGVIDNDGTDRSIGILVRECFNTGIRDCNITESMGAGISITNVKSGIVDNCNLKDCWGLNSTLDPSGAYDNYGDGIHVVGSEGVHVSNCTILNVGGASRPARGGIIFEFGTSNSTIKNCTIGGYDRTIHLEGNINRTSVRDVTCERTSCAIVTSGDTTNEVVIDGLRFTGGEQGFTGTFSDGLIYLYNGSDRVSITNCTIENVPSSIVYLLIANGQDVEDLYIDNCTFSGNGTSRIESNSVKNALVNKLSANDCNSISLTGNAENVRFKSTNLINTTINASNVKKINFTEGYVSGASKIDLTNCRNGSSVTDTIFENVTGQSFVIGNFNTANPNQRLNISNNTLLIGNNATDATFMVEFTPSAGNHEWYSSGPNQIVDSTTVTPVVTKQERIW